MDRLKDPVSRPADASAEVDNLHVPSLPAATRRRTHTERADVDFGVLPDPELTLRGTQLIGPVWTWMLGVFGLCYIVFSGLITAITPGSSHLSTLGADLLSYALAGALLAGVLVVTRPKVVVRNGGGLAQPGPWVAASLGGLLVWALTHNTVPWLVPFAAMDGLEAVTFLGSNIVEHTLIGMMLASFTTRPALAFLYGAGFGAAVLAIWSWLLFL